MKRRKEGIKRGSKRYAACLAILLVFVVILNFDLPISSFVTSFQGGIVEDLLLLLTDFGTLIILGFSSLLVYLYNRKSLLKLWVGLVFSWSIGVLIKLIVARPRPFTVGINTPIQLIESKYLTWDSSFPSLHAVTSFVVIPFLPKKVRLPWTIFAVIISLSRVYFGLHYLSDAIFGAAMGLAISYVISSYEYKSKK